MGYPSRIKAPRNTGNQYKKYLREKDKAKKAKHRRLDKQDESVVTEAEFVVVTLKRLHTLGAQKFGSSPFSEHFNRWLINVEAVLEEFEVHFSVCVDEQFRDECAETLNIIHLQLEERRQKEAIAEQETKNLHYCRTSLKQINIEYATTLNALKAQKNSEVTRLNKIIAQLKNDQDKIIRLKTGFWRVSQKKNGRKKN